ncbi:MAG: SRPBCC family protein [Actinomycetota bacterium]
MGAVQETKVVNGSIDQAWEAISQMRAVQDWHPNVAKVTVLTDHQQGLGAARRVEFHDGNSVVETVTAESDREFVAMAMTEAQMMKEAEVTISVAERSAETTEVTFALTYTMSMGPLGALIGALMMRRVFTKVFGMALAGLSYHLQTGNVVEDSVPELA